MTTISHTFDTDDVHHVISLGAGVQSTVMYLMAAHGELSPKPEAAIFADTRWEPVHVYRHLDWMQSLGLDIPIFRVRQGDLYQNTWDGAKVDSGRKYAFTDIPAFTRQPDGSRGMTPRQCTEHYKIVPIQRKAREIIGRPPRARASHPPFLVQWMGISTDEWMRCRDARPGWIYNAYPLIEAGMSRANCLAWFQARYPDRPIARSSCVGCPYHSNAEWLRLYREDPDGMARTMVSFNQGVNIRLVNEEAAGALASVRYYDGRFTRRRLYTAWDNLGQERVFFRGLDTQRSAGIPPKHLMVYMLVGYAPDETMDQVLYRYHRLKDAGCKPYPMVYNDENKLLKAFQRWVVGRFDRDCVLG